MDKTFEYYIETKDFHFKYAKGEPAAKGQEFHDYNEFLFFVNGKSNFISKNIQQELIPGCLVLIPKEHFHQFCVIEQNDYIRCVLGFRDLSELNSLISDVMDSVKLILYPDKNIIGIFENLITITTSKLADEEKKLFISSSINQLLIYLKFTIQDTIVKRQTLSPVVSQALDMIDENFSTNLSVNTIARSLHTSPSTLAHKFSKELNVPIYRYISKKRLSEAHKLIENGETYSYAALNCGFSDYSCFYRLYKKYYK